MEESKLILIQPMPSFKKTDKQRLATELMASNARHIMLYGGSRSGKTAINCRNIMIRASKVKSRHIALRLHFNSAKTSLWLDTIPKIRQLCFPDLEIKTNSSDYYLKFPNDSEFWIAGLDDAKRVEKILGKEFSTMFFNECSELSYSAVQVALTRLAEKNDLAKKVYYDMNPPTKSHWSYWQFEKKLNPIDNEPLKRPQDYASLLMNPIDNLENIDPDYLTMLEGLPLAERNRFMLGLYGDNTGGQVYYAFNREKHVQPIKQDPGTLIIGNDFNVNPMTAIVSQYLGKIFYIYDEAFLENSDTWKMADYLISKNYVGDVIPDSTGRNRKTSGQSDFDILSQKGFTIIPTRNPAISDRVNNVNRLFTENRIIIDPKCKKLINDLEKVRWKDNQLDQTTDKMLTHISDCLGYVCWKLDPFGMDRASRSFLL